MRKRPGSGSGGLSTFSRFLEASAASAHQLITLRTLRTLRENFFGGLRPRPGSVFGGGIGCQRGIVQN